MIRNIGILLLFTFFSGCTERYEFVVPNETEGVVIEAFISNQSYINTLNYPSDGRRFSVRLTETSDVTNIRGEDITEAEVVLFSDKGDSWTYIENVEKAGEYILFNSDFAAQEGIKYRLTITLPSGNIFESNWETLPAEETQLGEITIEETTKESYVYRGAGEKTLVTREGINVSVNIPKNEGGELVYYRWNYKPLWLYTAPEADPGSSVQTCWIRNPYYLRGYDLEAELVGGYDKELFFLETTGNNRVYEYFSVLIIQSVVSENYYYFWKDLSAQNEKGGLYDQPPFNLPTNFTAVNNTQPVNGFFGVVTENATRWVLDYNELSYAIDNNIMELCLIDYGPPAPGEQDECENCLSYTLGEAVNQAPWWW